MADSTFVLKVSRAIADDRLALDFLWVEYDRSVPSEKDFIRREIELRSDKIR